MRIPRVPHRWSVSPERAAAIQRRLARLVRIAPPGGPIRLVAGVDAAADADGRKCVAAAVVWHLEKRRAVEQTVARRPLVFPYVPGLLSFREAPAILAALRKLRTAPDVVVCDGHGLAHPRRFGIACHVGVVADLPTVGCAKSCLVGQHAALGDRRGSSVPLVEGGETIGRVLRTRDGVRPLFVSVGHRIDLDAAERVVLACTPAYRLPEPLRLADQLARRLVRSGRSPARAAASARGDPAPPKRRKRRRPRSA